MEHKFENGLINMAFNHQVVHGDVVGEAQRKKMKSDQNSNAGTRPMCNNNTTNGISPEFIRKEKNITNMRKEFSNGNVNVSSIKNTCNVQPTNYRKWFILASGFFTYSMTVGFIFNMSVLYVEWLSEFGRPYAETALVQSTCSGVFFIGESSTPSVSGLGRNKLDIDLQHLQRFVDIGFSIKKIAKDGLLGGVVHPNTLYKRLKQNETPVRSNYTVISDDDLSSLIADYNRNHPNSGFVSGSAVTKYGSKKCGMIGGMITTLGFVSSFFATSITYLVILQGIIPGFGLSLCQISTSTSVGRHFKGKSKIMALSFMAFGSGIGAIVFPILLEVLTVEYGWRGTLLIVGGIMFNLVVCASMHSMPIDMPTKHPTSLNQSMESDSKPQNSMDNRENVYGTTNKPLPNGSGLLNILVSLFRNKSYLLYTISVALCLSTFTTPLISLIDYFQSKGISRTDAVMIYIYMSICNTVARLLPGILKQIPHLSVVFIAALSALVGCISAALFPFVGSSYSLNTVVACSFKLGHAILTSLMAIAIVTLVGQDHFSAAIGITMTATGICQTLAGPLSGYIRDITGNYDASFFCTSAALFVSCVLFMTTMVYRYYQNRNKHHKSDSTPSFGQRTGVV